MNIWVTNIPDVQIVEIKKENYSRSWSRGWNCAGFSDREVRKVHCSYVVSPWLLHFGEVSNRGRSKAATLART